MPAGRTAEVAATGALAVLALGYARVPSVERACSWLPVRDLVLVGGATLLAMALSGAYPTSGLRSIAAVVGSAAAATALTVAVRRRLRRRQSALLVGDRLAVAQCIEHWAGRQELDIRGVCLVEAPHDASDRPSEVLGIPVVSTIDDAPEVATMLRVDQVVVAPGPLVTSYDVRRLGWSLERTRIRVGVTAEVHGAAPHRVRPRLVGRRVVLDVAPSVRPRLHRLVKATVDRVLGAVLLGVFAPLLGGLALVVRLDSRGPAMFRQVRAGRNGTPFTMYKLRTMCVDAEALLDDLIAQNEGAGPLFKMTSDPRVTRIGRFLRKTSLDELPQLINVVKGQMSLIGPRPSLLTEVASYDEWVARRLAVKPGMTGLWQVSGRSSLSWNDSVGLDLGYVDNWTPAGDLAIAMRTFKAVIHRDGAA
ncbi:sugar transferase [Solicola gregarius]|uniref:Sugar transferase n=1 Tax=Solicola gregarius TaxID=2908642 RepID=A0AA46TK39_9ACTN|nr:sugar transferase [Solicola gregarius]UYM06560.1 sugar transferase [Solicola gregarius]